MRERPQGTQELGVLVQTKEKKFLRSWFLLEGSSRYGFEQLIQQSF